MKRLFLYIVLLGVAVAGTMMSCSSNTYARQLRAEKKLIEDYIKRNGIQVIYKEPEVWGEKDYLKVEGYDNFYFHLVDRGTTDTVDVKAADRVLVRY